jgi:hypothetical protein
MAIESFDRRFCPACGKGSLTFLHRENYYWRDTFIDDEHNQWVSNEYLVIISGQKRFFRCWQWVGPNYNYWMDKLGKRLFKGARIPMLCSHCDFEWDIV